MEAPIGLQENQMQTLNATGPMDVQVLLGKARKTIRAEQLTKQKTAITNAFNKAEGMRRQIEQWDANGLSFSYAPASRTLVIRRIRLGVSLTLNRSVEGHLINVTEKFGGEMTLMRDPVVYVVELPWRLAA